MPFRFRGPSTFRLSVAALSALIGCHDSTAPGGGNCQLEWTLKVVSAVDEGPVSGASIWDWRCAGTASGLGCGNLYTVTLATTDATGTGRFRLEQTRFDPGRLEFSVMVNATGFATAQPREAVQYPCAGPVSRTTTVRMRPCDPASDWSCFL